MSGSCRGTVRRWIQSSIPCTVDIFRYFTGNVTKPNCELAVIDAGMPRTGSTLLSLLIDDAVKKVQEAFGWRLKIQKGGYWRLNRHMQDPKKKYHLNIPDGTDIVTIKSHEFDSELLTLCKQNLIILTRREPAAMLASGIIAFSEAFREGQASNCDFLAHSIFYSVRRHACWQAHAQFPLRVAYEDFRKNKAPATTAIATEIATILDLGDGITSSSSSSSSSSEDGGTHISFRFPADYRADEANSIAHLKGSSSSSDDNALTNEIAHLFPSECNDRFKWDACFRRIM